MGDGEAVVVWTSSASSARSTVRSALRTAGGSWQEPVTLSDPTLIVTEADVTARPFGVAAVWVEIDPLYPRLVNRPSRVRAAVRSRTGAGWEPSTFI
jgi:hypothetical protein